MAICRWILYCCGQAATNPLWGALSDRVGRRPLLVIGSAGVTLTMMMFSIPNGPLFAAVGLIQGLFDNTWALCNAIVVDCAMVGALPGDVSDYWFARLLRGVLEVRRIALDAPILTHSGSGFVTGLKMREDTVPSSAVNEGQTSATDERLRAQMSSAFTTVWVIAGSGTVLGFGIGYALTATTSLVFAMFCSGLIMVPTVLFIQLSLPETKPETRRLAGTCSREEQSHATQLVVDEVAHAFADQAVAISLVFHGRRSSLLAVAYFAVYLTLTGAWAFGLFWGQDVYGWSSGYSTAFLVSLSIGAGFGILLVVKWMVPFLGYANGLSLVTTVSAVAAFGIVMVSSRAPAFLIFLLVIVASLAFGTYPTLTALLTTQIAHETQGQLQGALFAFTTLGSLAGLCVYLVVFTVVAPESIWVVSAVALFVAALAIFVAGEGDESADRLSTSSRSTSSATLRRPTEPTVASRTEAAGVV